MMSDDSNEEKERMKNGGRYAALFFFSGKRWIHIRSPVPGGSALTAISALRYIMMADFLP
ncbi:hypothetical protein D3C71_1438600 [compost metagenome]